MKTKKKVDQETQNENVVIQLFQEYFQQRIEEEKREKQTLLDKFDIHLKGKDIVLDNSNA